MINVQKIVKNFTFAVKVHLRNYIFTKNKAQILSVNKHNYFLQIIIFKH